MINNSLAELSVADIIFMLAKWCKLLIIVPVISAFITITCYHIMPNIYKSVAILNVPETVMSKLYLSAEFDPEIKELIHSKGVKIKNNNFRQKITFSIDKKSGLVVLTVEEKSPELAKRLCEAVVRYIVKNMEISDYERASIRQEIRVNEYVINKIDRWIVKVNSSGDSLVEKKYNQMFQNAVNEAARRKMENFHLARRLNWKADEIVINSPSFSETSIEKNLLAIVLFVAITSEFFLISFLLFYGMVKNSRNEG